MIHAHQLVKKVLSQAYQTYQHQHPAERRICISTPSSGYAKDGFTVLPCSISNCVVRNKRVPVYGEWHWQPVIPGPHEPLCCVRINEVAHTMICKMYAWCSMNEDIHIPMITSDTTLIAKQTMIAAINWAVSKTSWQRFATPRGDSDAHPGDQIQHAWVLNTHEKKWSFFVHNIHSTIKSSSESSRNNKRIERRVI